MVKILVTGATGFIGKRLVYKMLDEGHEVYALVRNEQIRFKASENGLLHLIVGDLETIQSFPNEIDVAYFLVHSMGQIQEDLIDSEKRITQNFLKLTEKTRCKQIIYLGGIIEDEVKLSVHLRSRLYVETILRNSAVPCTALRSSIIIGAGSASFEIIRDLTEKLPVMVAPKWVKNYCQPISILDVLFYLSAVVLNEKSYGNIYDIGGPEVLTFREILLRYAKFIKLKRYIINVPVLTPKLSSYWLVLITSVKFSICKYLVESMKQNSRKLNNSIDLILPHDCLTYENALSRAFQKISQNEVVSTWMDAWDLKKPIKGIDVPEEGCLKDIQIIQIKGSFEKVIERIWTIGGDTGWYSMNWAWKLRGFIDQIMGGIGFNRGRRDPYNLEVGDSVDFWRVLHADKESKHLILFAQMKTPGEAWLEFKITPDGKSLIHTATFRPKGILGLIYWYALIPFHWVIFKNMARAIANSEAK